MKLLVTGFEPFGGELVNPALQVLDRLKNAYEGVEIIKLTLPVVFHGSLKVLEESVLLHRPDVVICLGQAGGRPQITVERVGINLDDARIADNAGNSPIDSPIDPQGPDAYFSTLPIKAIVKAMMDEKIPATVSNSAGTYVCNHVLYGICHLIKKHSLNAKAGFIHVPFLPEQVVNNSSMPSMSIETIVKGIEVALKTCVTVDCDIVYAVGTES